MQRYESDITGMSAPRIEYAYSYQDQPTCESDEGLVIKLACPSLSSYRWCVRLYCLVLGCVGVLLASAWVLFHTYVLHQTSLEELREQR